MGMVDDVSDIAALYSHNPQGGRGRLERHELERDPTWGSLKTYLLYLFKLFDPTSNNADHLAMFDGKVKSQL